VHPSTSLCPYRVTVNAIRVCIRWRNRLLRPPHKKCSKSGPFLPRCAHNEYQSVHEWCVCELTQPLFLLRLRLLSPPLPSPSLPLALPSSQPAVKTSTQAKNSFLDAWIKTNYSVQSFADLGRLNEEQKVEMEGWAFLGEMSKATEPLTVLHDNARVIHVQLTRALEHVQDTPSRLHQCRVQVTRMNEAARALATLGTEFYHSDQSPRPNALGFFGGRRNASLNASMFSSDPFSTR
jgi:hypothetical protein